MGFNLQASHLPPLSFSPYSLSKTCTVGGEDAVSCLRGNLPSLPPDHGDDGSGRLGQSSTQRSSSDLWSRAGDRAANGKGSSVAAGEHYSNNKNRPAANNIVIDSLSVGAMRMKKVKVRRKVREPRFCFKTMSEVDVLDDGYKWRKYGQKVVKNTQHPSLKLCNRKQQGEVVGPLMMMFAMDRSYYRCTQENCRVKKRIERMAEDPRMVITTYEGRHVHSPSHAEEESQPSSEVTLFW
ncbi:hypothetical protein GW17_00004952 [Ensete ventricosum]|nr:hypothetical protein GW17_00004952 [Ensete ventricosum]